LYPLQRKNATFELSGAQQVAFEQLKAALISAPIQGMPTGNGTFYLDKDASDTGLGAVLPDDQNGTGVVIAYASRTLTKPEVNYDVTRRELLAVIFGFKTFRQYLLGRHFFVRSDKAGLQWLRSTPEPMWQLARWLAFIEQYFFTVVYRKGTQHGNADGLSRRPREDVAESETRGTPPKPKKIVRSRRERPDPLNNSRATAA